jgi:hypothetical protein
MPAAGTSFARILAQRRRSPFTLAHLGRFSTSNGVQEKGACWGQDRPESTNLRAGVRTLTEAGGSGKDFKSRGSYAAVASI